MTRPNSFWAGYARISPTGSDQIEATRIGRPAVMRCTGIKSMPNGIKSMRVIPSELRRCNALYGNLSGGPKASAQVRPTMLARQTLNSTLNPTRFAGEVARVKERVGFPSEDKPPSGGD